MTDRHRPTLSRRLSLVLGPPLRLLRRRGPHGLRVAAWAIRARRRVRRQVAHGGLDAVRPPAPPPGPDADREVVLAALRRTGANCLERSLVLQRWDAAHWVPRTLVIGVTAPSTGFHAHAWLDGDPDPHRAGMNELLRRPPDPGWLPDADEPGAGPPRSGRARRRAHAGEPGQARSTRP
ncbi:lasso peptide biosynthesis B2 protein [Micromonospora carbonacea]|uniref:lasso peptide biosynthesis B2 protein n=1 Tax=Micromonospora carbonacea TaxID=47853 RepID=UPI00159F1F8B|nr:lasso peptide biosynthesis B2 protein [Micromonospora carbonacea]